MGRPPKRASSSSPWRMVRTHCGALAGVEAELGGGGTGIDGQDLGAGLRRLGGRGRRFRIGAAGVRQETPLGRTTCIHNRAKPSLRRDRRQMQGRPSQLWGSGTKRGGMGDFRLITNDLAAICQIRATLSATVEFDLKFLPVPVTAYTQHFHIAFAVNQ